MNSESIEERQKAEIAFSSAKYSDAILHFEKAIMLILSNRKAEEYYDKYKFDNASIKIIKMRD